jgi:molybdopterin converting factor small subunit
MEIAVTLHTPLQFNGLSKATIGLETPATIDTLLNLLSIEQYEVGSVYVNGTSTTFNHSLFDGDRVSLLPLIGGG